VAARSETIGRWLRGSSIGSGRGFRGGTCRPRSVRGRRCGSGIDGSALMAPGTASIPGCWSRPTVWGSSCGTCRWTSRSTVPISMRRTWPGPQGDLSSYTNLGLEPADHALGRSRGGLSTKIHHLTDGKGRPLVMLVAPGQGGDSPMFAHLLAALSVPRVGPGRPRTRPDRVLGDKAYSSRAKRQLLRSRHPLRQTRPHLPRRCRPPSHHHLATPVRRHALVDRRG